MIIASLAAFIVLRVQSNKNSQVDPQTDQTDTQNEQNSTSDDSKETTTYATSFRINADKTIVMRLGEKVNLLDGFISIEPANKLDELETQVSGRYNYASDGISVENFSINANALGEYNVDFLLKKNATKYFDDNRIIVKVQNVEQLVVCDVNNLVRANSYSLNNIFQFNADSFDVDFTFDSSFQVDLDLGLVMPQEAGNFDITVALTKNFVQYKYSFHFVVEMEPEYSIEIYNYPAKLTSRVENNGKDYCYVDYEEDLVLKFMYRVVDSNHNEGVSQLISCVSQNSGVVSVDSANELYFKLQIKNIGQAEINVKLIEDENITKTLVIVVE